MSKGRRASCVPGEWASAPAWKANGMVAPVERPRLHGAALIFMVFVEDTGHAKSDPTPQSPVVVRQQERVKRALFVSQRFDWIQFGRPVGRVETETDTDRRTHDQSGQGPTIRENQIHFEPSRQQIASDHAKHNS